MKIHNVQQGSAEWLALRTKYFTASQAPAMMGASIHQSRDDLLKEKSTGERAPITPQLQAIFDKGHAAEDNARPLAENILGEELYPVVATEGELLASFDGITIADDVVFEHKLWNESLAEQVALHNETGDGLEPHYYWQLEQQLLVSEANYVVFVASDGTPEKWAECHYISVPERQEALLDGWEQFKKDLADYIPVEFAKKIDANSVASLPALHIEINSNVNASNFPLFRNTVLAQVADINTNLQTDQDFADAEAMVKHLNKAEKALDETRTAARKQTADIDELFRALDELKNAMRDKRLQLNKLVTARKAAIKTEIIAEAHAELQQHIAEVESLLPVRLRFFGDNFEACTKNKRTVKSLHGAVADQLAQHKIEIEHQRKNIVAAQEQLYKKTAALEVGFLFHDVENLLFMTPETLHITIDERINEHSKREEARLSAERERIRLEEAARVAAAQPAPSVAADETATQTVTVAKNETVACDLVSAAAPKKDETMVTIPAREYSRLLNDSLFLEHLFKSGLESWEHYENAVIKY